MNKHLLATAASAALLSMVSNAYADDIFSTAPLPAVPGSQILCTVVNGGSRVEVVRATLFRANNNGTAAVVKKSAETALIVGEGFKISFTNVGNTRNFFCQFEGDDDSGLAAALVVQKGEMQNSETAAQRHCP